MKLDPPLWMILAVIVVSGLLGIASTVLFSLVMFK